MRLLHTAELRFKEFYGSDIPSYATLSHRWGDDEVSYQDFLAIRSSHSLEDTPTPDVLQSDIQAKSAGAGYKKILGACSCARDVWEWDWIWIDTCCIDKTSSSELSQAINSMFEWYARSRICIVYLSDVADAVEEKLNGYAEFRQSIWFRRGWTLQELLASRKLAFYDADWRYMGEKTDHRSIITEITGIDGVALLDLNNVHLECAATKMGWAAGRRTTRIEDQAYCLLGLFNVNMPLMYGEGRRAFLRLQREIIAQSDDESILVHRNSFTRTTHSSVDDPDHFLLSSRVSRFVPQDFRRYTELGRHPFTMTNKGLLMTAAIIVNDIQASSFPGMVIALNCTFEDSSAIPVLLEVLPKHVTDWDWGSSTALRRSSWVGGALSLPSEKASYSRSMRLAIAKMESFVASDQIKKADPFTYDEILLC